jgi:hydroxyacylglutathione hydrolase
MTELEIIIIPALVGTMDNYIYGLRDAASGKAAIVDPAEAAPVLQTLKDTGWQLDYIINTHHHWDHTDGNLELKAATASQVVGARADRHRIPGIDMDLGEEDTFELGESVAQILEIPGHTSGHIALWFPEAQALFSGDTLFSIGCGRVFEGTYEQMWQSLQKLSNLPDETKLYCGHEYTVKNARFALTVEPNNKALQNRLKDAQESQARGEPTIPSTIAEERAANPFLRPDSPEIRQALGLEDADDLTVFTALREAKDRF